MKGSHNRLLQVVIGAMLLNVAPDGRAETYDLSGVRATIPDDDWHSEGADFETGYNWDFNDDYYEPPESGDGYPDDPEQVNEEKKAECDAIAAKVSSTCDLRNPPLQVANGCGSGVTTYLVPDYLTVNGMPVLRLGPIFQDACNMHDVCYGNYPGNKEACDLSLNTNMINQAKLLLTDWQWMYYGAFVKLQALGYSAGLQAPFISYISGGAFSEAQLDGACRVYAGKAKTAGCFD